MTAVGDETRQVVEKLETVIRTTAGCVGEIKTAVAVLNTKQDSMHGDVKKMNGRLGEVEDRTDSLEGTRDRAKGIHKALVIVGSLLVGVPGLVWTAIKIVEWIKV